MLRKKSLRGLQSCRRETFLLGICSSGIVERDVELIEKCWLKKVQENRREVSNGKLSSLRRPQLACHSDEE